MTSEKVFHVKILDFKYLTGFEQLNFWYLTYEVTAKNKKEAVKKARKQYMNMATRNYLRKNCRSC
jgi:hypothetical protein